MPDEPSARVLPRPRHRHARDRRRHARDASSSDHRQQHVDRGARRGPAARVRRAHARPAPGGDLVGGLATAAATRRSGGWCSPRTRTATCAANGNSVPSDADRVRALSRRPAAARRRRDQRRVVAPRTRRRAGSAAPRAPVDLATARLRPAARHALAADLLQRHHRRGSRRMGRQRARGAGPRRRARRRQRARSAPQALSCRSARSARCRSCASWSCRSRQMPAGVGSGRSCTACSTATEFAARDLASGADASVLAGAERAGRSIEAADRSSCSTGLAGGDRDAARRRSQAGRACAPARPRRPARRARVRAAARRRG